MADIWSHDKLLLFLAFFVPGFISMQVYSLFVPTAPRDFTKSLPEAMAYSAIHYAVFGWIFFILHGAWFVAATYVVVLVLPALEPFAFLLIRDWEVYRTKFSSGDIMKSLSAPEADPWDRIFITDNHPKWLRIHLKNGDIVAGYYGRGSHASAHPHPHEIYISEQWYVDESGLPLRPTEDTGGFLVSAGEIRLIEFYEKGMVKYIHG